MKYVLPLLIVFTLFGPALNGAPLEFVATVDSVTEVDGETLLTVQITPTVSIGVRVTGLTEIKDETGLPISAEDLEPGQTVHIEGLFTDLGILALEIEVLDGTTDFELRGEIENIGVDQITLLDLPIQVPEAAEIKDEFGNPLTLDDLEAGNLVKVEGVIDGNDLVADEIKRLTEDSFARISFLGIIEEFPADDQILVALDGGAKTLVEITEETSIRGTLSIGAVVKVIGLINTELFVTALKVNVVSALIELSPPRLKMGFEETRRVDVILREALESDLVLQIQSADPSIAQASTDELIIPEGALAGFFEVTSDSVEGKTQIDLVSPDFGLALSLKVEVKEGGPGEDELEIKWSPQIIRADPNEVREVSVFLKKGSAPDDLTVTLSLVEGPAGLATFPTTVVIPAGQRRVRFEIQLLSQPGKSVIRAALPEEVGGATDDLIVELGPGQLKVGLQWSPSQVKAGPNQAHQATLKLSQLAPFPVTVSIVAKNGDSSVVSGFPSEVTFGEGEQEKTVSFSTTNKEGKVTFRATLPDELGGRHDDLRVVVKN